MKTNGGKSKFVPLVITGDGCDNKVANPWYIAPCLATSRVTIGPVRTKYSAALRKVTNADDNWSSNFNGFRFRPFDEPTYFSCVIPTKL